MWKKPVGLGAKRTRTGIFFFLEGAAELLEGDVLELTNPLAGHAEFLADFFERLGLLPGEAETGVDDLALTLVEDLEEVVELHVHVLVAEELERCLGLLVTDDLTELGRVVVADGGIERGGTQRG